MQSLGLRWRSENLVHIAETVIDLFDGEVPDDDLGLRMLPGVGDYVAQAVLCFAFDRRACCWTPTRCASSAVSTLASRSDAGSSDSTSISSRSHRS